MKIREDAKGRKTQILTQGFLDWQSAVSRNGFKALSLSYLWVNPEHLYQM
jgi:hypothetical protein